MAEFKINIIDTPSTPITYTSHVGAYEVERCSPSSRLEYFIKLQSIDPKEFAILSSYTGDQWKYLNITSIDLSTNSESCNCLEMEYNNSLLDNTNLPLKLDIETLSSINNIPLLKVATDNYDALSSSFTGAINIRFSIEDINGTIGETIVTSFQIKFIDCSIVTIETPVINSVLTYSTDMAEPDSYFFDYYITSTFPVTSYGASGLPVGSTFNSTTGYIGINTLLYDERHTDVILQFDISATNSGAIPTTDTKTFTLTIVPFRGYLA